MKANGLAAKPTGGSSPLLLPLGGERLLWAAFGVLAILWTAICGGSLVWNLRQNRHAIMDLARTGARAILQRDLLYRHWAAGHGGVYVPATEATPPNPYLTNVVERDITTPSGRKLTLVNPAYMTRQVHELGSKEGDYRGHITSLNPIRLANAADAWETNALRIIERDRREVSSVEMVEGQPHLRLMLPMVTERGCLKCHAAQGYKEGEIRGGLGVTLPLKAYTESVQPVERAALQAHGLIWLLGVGGLGGSFYFLSRRTRDRDAAVASLQAVEAELEDFYQNAPDMFCSVDAHTGKIVACNQAFAGMLGRRQKDLLGQPVIEIYHPDSQPQAREAFSKFQQRGEIRNVELQLVGKEGRRIDVEMSATAIRDEQGQIVRSRSVLRDITEQNRMAQALRESHDLIVKLTAQVPGVVYQYRLHPDGRSAFPFASPGMNDIYEVTPEEVRTDATPVFGRLHPEDHDRIVADIQESARTLQPFHCEFRVVLPRQGLRWRLCDAMPERTEDGGTLWHGIISDITERRRAQEELRQSEERYRRLFDEGTEGIAVADCETGILLDCNKAMLELAGWEKSELIGQPQTVLHPPEDRKGGASQSFQAHRGEKSGQVIEATLLTKKGERKSVEVKATVLELNDRKVVQGFFRDITQRKQTESALHEQEERYRVLFNGITDAVFVHGIRDDDLPGEFLAVNDALCRRLRYSREELLQMTVLDIDAPESTVDRTVVVRKLKAGESVLFEQTHVARDGRRIPVEIHVQMFLMQGRPLVLSVSRDITDRKQAEQARTQLEAQLRQSQKMEAIGQLAGGVAHDFNNILTVIMGSADLLVAETELAKENRELAQQIAEAGRRAANLTRQLLAFSRKQVMQVRPLDLNEVLGQILKMLQRVLGEHITLNCTYAPDLPRLKGDAAMLEQVIMNLAVNARDAMPKGGRLLITTGAGEVGPAHVQRNAEARPGRFVTLAITDTGCGMDTDTLAHIFEPFFTTKEVGKGTGLGLATVYGIIKQHGGWLEVASEPGQGSTFTAFLPATFETAPGAPADAPAETAPRGDETILLVEDDASVRRMVLTCLERCGYRVLEASQGQEALRLWEEAGGRVDLLLTDLVMPGGMSGREVAEALLKLKPQLKILFSSGYDREALSSESANPSGSTFLPKPYDPVTLAKIVRAMLDRG